MARGGVVKRTWRSLDVPPEIHQMSTAEALPLLARAADGRVLVSFSGGKDSVGCVEQLRPYFSDIRLVFFETVPGLRFVSEMLDYYERRWQCHIPRMTHPAFHWGMGAYVYNTPLTRSAVEWWDPVWTATFEAAIRRMKWSLGWSDRVPSAVGIKKADSVFRRSALNHTGPYNAARNNLHPCYDLSNDQLYALLEARGVRLAVDYHLFFRSFDGVDYRFLGPLREHYPDDYRRILQWYPTVHASLKRYEYAEAREREDAGFAL